MRKFGHNSFSRLVILFMIYLGFLSQQLWSHIRTCVYLTIYIQSETMVAIIAPLQFKTFSLTNCFNSNGIVMINLSRW